MERRRWWIAPSILGIALMVALVWGFNEKNRQGRARGGLGKPIPEALLRCEKACRKCPGEFVQGHGI